MTPEQIKNNFRVHQIGNDFFIQEKSLFGWSYDTSSNTEGLNRNLPGFYVAAMVMFFVSLLGSLITLVWSLISFDFSLLLIFSLSTVLFFFFLTLIEYNCKELAIKAGSLKYAEDDIDVIVRKRLINEQEKEAKKLAKQEQKYHYFYSTKKLRKEKLKKLK